jgi:hypothetical protein
MSILMGNQLISGGMSVVVPPLVSIAPTDGVNKPVNKINMAAINHKPPLPKAKQLMQIPRNHLACSLYSIIFSYLTSINGTDERREPFKVSDCNPINGWV